MFCRATRFVPLSLIALALFQNACSKKEAAAGPPPRYAVVRFENLSGDASLDWVARATADYLSRTLSRALNGPVLNTETLARNAAGLGAEPGGAPGSSAQRADAVAAGATRLVSGSIEKGTEGIRIAATTEDLSTHKTVQFVAVSAPAALKAMDDLAHAFSPNAARYLTSDAEALRLYTTAADEPPAEAVKTLEQAVARDANFGPAWVALVALTSRSGDRTGAEALIAKASAQKIDSLDQANLEVERANLGSDANAKIQALAHLSQLTPADTGLLRTLATVESSQGKFSESARDWQRLASLLPGNADALNQEGYNRAWSGDLAGALRAFAEYERVRPSDPNVLDSRGDVQYLYRKFQDAAASYLAAYAKNPQFESGGDLYKAAWAQFESGDQAKAEASFAKFQTAREKTREDLRELIQADWLYRTGHPKEAMALLRKAQASPTLSSQLAIWDLMAGDRAAAAKDMSSITQISSGAMLVAKFVSLPSAAEDEWRKRADQMIRGNGSEAVRAPALGYALILDGKRAAATQVWEKIVETAPATDFFSRAVLAKLKGEKPKFALLPDPNASNQMRALVD